VTIDGTGGGSVTGSAAVLNEVTCTTTTGTSSGMGFDFTTNKDNFHCVGALLTPTDLTTNTYTAGNYFKGIMAQLSVST
jgi:hypothetical protein